jgi:FkbM family methyltransferase
MSIMKIPVNLLCCFVPLKKWRKKIRCSLIGAEKRLRREFLDYGCEIENEIVTTPEGVKIDISREPREAMGIAKAVILNKEYAVNFGGDAILIDIGLNRGMASLFFAAYPNIRKIYSFEPFKPTFELAKKNLELNPQLSEKINAFNFGLGKAEVTLELPYKDTATGNMSTTHDVCKGKKNIKIETVVIKDAAKEIASILEENENKRIIVKCDCEGAEFEIFERLNKVNIISRIDVVTMEYHFEKPDRLVDILVENGFAVQTKSSPLTSWTGSIYAVRMAERTC